MDASRQNGQTAYKHRMDISTSVQVRSTPHESRLDLTPPEVAVGRQEPRNAVAAKVEEDDLHMDAAQQRNRSGRMEDTGVCGVRRVATVCRRSCTHARERLD
eukprot:2478093-Pleurochrysis_carterae.AAC.2